MAVPFALLSIQGKIRHRASEAVTGNFQDYVKKVENSRILSAILC